MHLVGGEPRNETTDLAPEDPKGHPGISRTTPVSPRCSACFHFLHKAAELTKAEYSGRGSTLYLPTLQLGKDSCFSLLTASAIEIRESVASYYCYLAMGGPGQHLDKFLKHFPDNFSRAITGSLLQYSQ